MEVEKLKDCLVKLALKSGFDSINNFVKYKEENVCNGKYIAVYPEIQIRLTFLNVRFIIINIKQLFKTLIRKRINLVLSKRKETIQKNSKSK